MQSKAKKTERNSSLGFSMPSSQAKPTSAFPLRPLRQPVALSFLKSVLLGDQHVPGDPQTDDVMEALESLDALDVVGPKTWSSWFGANPRAPQRKKFEELDALAQRLASQRAPTSPSPIALPVRCLFEIACGGMMAGMLAPTTSNQPKHVLAARANDYMPLSGLHLHLDAIEVAALTNGFGSVSWEEVTTTAASRVMNVLHSWWSPRGGAIYESFASNLAIEWDRSNEAEREEIRTRYRRFRPSLFEADMSCGARPRWDRIGIDSDIPARHVHRLLLGVAADAEFLIADRFDAWVTDLATAAIAMYALAWTDRYRTFGAREAGEKIYWRAFDMLLFDPEDRDELSECLGAAVDLAGVKWSTQTIDRLRQARETYRESIWQAGLTREDIRNLIYGSSRVHRLVYQG